MMQMSANQLSIIDAAFLALEQRTMPLHIGLVAVFRPPPNADKNYVSRIAERLSRSMRAAAPFNLRPERTLGRWRWVEDCDFDLEHHFAHIALPRPGGAKELFSLVSRLHSSHFDRAFPLWSWYLIESLDDGLFAVYLKIHHSAVDGVAMVRLLFKAMSPDRAASTTMAPPWELPPAMPQEPLATGRARKPQDLPKAMSSLAENTLPIVRGLARELLQTWTDFRAENPAVVTSAQAPRTMFNGKVTGSRRFAAQSYATTRFRAISKALCCSTNDVVLAVTSTALRRYLASHDALPDVPLIGAVPVSVREDDFSESGNEVAFALISLATNTADPLERLRIIKKGMDYNKARFSKMTPSQIQAYAVAQLIPGAIGWLNRLDRSRVAVNVVISHIPAPRQAMYWQGCSLEGLYPISLVVDSVALNILLVSRLESIDFGLVACRKSVPGMQRMLDGIEQGLVELERIISSSPAQSNPVANTMKSRAGASRRRRSPR
jgi:diacylglycerol O-acyltransferase